MCVAGFWSSEGIFDEVGGGRGLLIIFGSLLFFCSVFFCEFVEELGSGFARFSGGV